MPVTNQQPQRKIYVDPAVTASGSGISWTQAYKTLAEVCTSLSGNLTAVAVYSRGQFRENILIYNAQNITWIGNSDPTNPTILRGTLTSNSWTVDGGLGATGIYNLTGVSPAPNAVVYDWKQDSVTGTTSGVVLPPDRAIDRKGVFYGHLLQGPTGATPSAGQWSYYPATNTLRVNPTGVTGAPDLTGIKGLVEYSRGWTGSGFDSTDTLLNGVYLNSCSGCTFSGIRAYLWTAPSPINKQIGYSFYGNSCTSVNFNDIIVVDCGYRAAGFSGLFSNFNSISNAKVYGGYMTGSSSSAELYYFVFYGSSGGAQQVTSGNRGYNNTVDHYPWLLTTGEPINKTSGVNQNVMFNFSHTSDPSPIPGGTICMGDIKYYGSRFYSHEAETNQKWYSALGPTSGVRWNVTISSAANVPAYQSMTASSYPVQHYFGYFDAPSFCSPNATRQCNTAFFNCYFTAVPYDQYVKNSNDYFSIALTGAAYFTRCGVIFNHWGTNNGTYTKGFFKLLGGCTLGVDLCSFHSGSTGMTQQSVGYFLDPVNIATTTARIRGSIFTKRGQTTATQNVFFRNMNSAVNTNHRLGWNIFYHPGVSADASTSINDNLGDYQASLILAAYGISGATNAFFKDPGLTSSTSDYFVPNVTGFAYTNRAAWAPLTGPSGSSYLSGATAYDGYPYNSMIGAYGLTTATGSTATNNTWNSYATEASKPSYLNTYDRALCVANLRGWNIPVKSTEYGQIETIVSIPNLSANVDPYARIAPPNIVSPNKGYTAANIITITGGSYFRFQVDVADVRGSGIEPGSLSLQASLPSWLGFTTPFKKRISDPADPRELGLYYAVVGGTAPTGATTGIPLGFTASNYYSSSGIAFALTITSS